MIAILSGLAAGLVHVFSGPDHLAAVAPFSVAHQEQHAGIGLRWGLGHALGVLIVGGLALLLRDLLPLEMLSAWAERLVGLMLIGIGVWGFFRLSARHVHAHEHVHDGRRHLHIHVHGREPQTVGTHGSSWHRHSHAAFGVGLLHGAAGSSHIWGVLPALAFPTKGLAATYLAAYGVGTIVAMVLFSVAMGAVARASSVGGVKAYRTLLSGAAASAVIIGGYWLAR